MFALRWFKDGNEQIEAFFLNALLSCICISEQFREYRVSVAKTGAISSRWTFDYVLHQDIQLLEQFEI